MSFEAVIFVSVVVFEGVMILVACLATRCRPNEGQIVAYRMRYGFRSSKSLTAWPIIYNIMTAQIFFE
jgi:hypothetical protein